MLISASDTSSLKAKSGGPLRAFRRMFAGLVLLLASAVPDAGHAEALKAAPDEWDKLQACERSVCKMILAKKAVDNVACKVTKTWEKKTLKPSDEGVPTDQSLRGDDPKALKWGFGDAQCTAELKLSAADIQAALVQPKHTINVSPHTVNCLVDRYGELKKVTATLSPRLDFKDGKAHKVWINLKDIDGPGDIKSFIKTTAKLEDSIGIFHGPMIKSINKWMFKKCDDKYGPVAEAKAEAEKAAAVKSAAEKNSTEKQQPSPKTKKAAPSPPAQVAPTQSSVVPAP